MAEAASNGDGKKIAAFPTKSFFIDMITRDITLAGCVLDLIDNSVHSLIRETNLDVMERLTGKSTQKVKDAAIDIVMSEALFAITDTCGGITIEDAEKDVFVFGNPQRDRQHTGLSVYGIGMKRALFKLGTKILVKSHTTDEEFAVAIDVDDWKKASDWNHVFKYTKQRRSAAGGTTIEVRDLIPANAARLKLTSFHNELRDRIGRAYSLFLQAGLRVSVNTIPAQPNLPELAQSKHLTPVRHLFKKTGVDILIMAGMSPRDDRRPRGWYVFCNGRLILDADKSERTGWGTGLPDFHSKFNHFVGYVYFRSKDERTLPWTTTKDDIEREAPIYQAALAEMRVLARPVLNFLSKMYPGEVQAEGVAERSVLEAAKGVAVEKVAKQANSTFAAEATKKGAASKVSIQYTRSRSDVNKVRKAIGKPRMPAYQVGEYTFDRFLEQECE